MRSRRVTAVAAALLAVAGVALPATTAASAAQGTGSVAAAPAGAGLPAHRVVMLPTGDRVEVATAAGGRVTATVPSPRSGSAPFRTIRSGPHLYVIPRSAVSTIGRTRPLSAFDVTAPGGPGVTPHFPMHTLTVLGTDLAGRPDTGAGVAVANIDDVRRFFGFQGFFQGRLKFSVPDGHYSASTVFFPLRRGQPVAVVVLPQFTVHGDTTITVDARTATSRVSVTTPRPARTGAVELTVAQTDRRGLTFANIAEFGPGFDLRVSPTRPVTIGQLHYYVYWRLLAADGSYTYDVEFPADGAIPAAQRYHVTAGQLATVSARYYSEVPRTGLETRFSFLPWQTFGFGTLFPVDQPRLRTEYVTASPDLIWQQLLLSYVDLVKFRLAGELHDADRTYAGGQRQTSQWNKQPTHPGVQVDFGTPIGNYFICPACRSAKRLQLLIWPFADNQPGHFGFPDFPQPSLTETLSSAVYVDGRRVGKDPVLIGLYAAGGRAADVRLVQDTVRRAAYFRLAVTTHTQWAFRAAAPSGAASLPAGWHCLDGTTSCSVLPLMTVRYELPVTLANRLAAGATRFTLDVAHVQGSPALPVTGATVSVSYDDGATWQRTAVSNLGGGRFAVAYTTPVRAGTNGYVALKVTAMDAAGGSLEQRILRAYAIG